MSRSLTFAKLVVLLAAAGVSFNGHARDSSDSGCIDEESFICVYPFSPVDSFGCRKNPLNCLPPSQPPRPGPFATGGGVGPGHSPTPKELESTNQAGLRAADCGELKQMEDSYKAHVETAKFALEKHKDALKDADARLADATFSEGAMNTLQDTTNLSCGIYEITRDRRLNGPKICTERGKGKPEICRVPGPSRAELEQFMSCRDDRRNQNARFGELAEWKRRKAAAEAGVQAMAANLRYVQSQLRRIQAEMARKNCAP